MTLLTRIGPELVRPADPEDYFAAEQIDLSAANKMGLPITLLAFLAIEQGISSPEQIEQVVKVIRTIR